MDPVTRPVPPPAPAPSHTGVVPRWRAWLSTVAALLIGLAVGRFGLADTVGLAAAALVAVVGAAGLVHELRAQHRDSTFDHITARHEVARALQERDA